MKRKTASKESRKQSEYQRETINNLRLWKIYYRE